MHSIDGSGRPRALRTWRRAAGLSQRELAERSGLGVGTIRDLEQGRIRQPRPASLRKLVSALGVTERELDLRPAARPEDPPLRLGVLGPLTARRHRCTVHLGPDQQRAVLGLLALHAGEPVRRGTIVQAIWEAHPPPSAANLVQVYVSRLRHLLDPHRRPGDRDGTIASWPGGYRLDPAAAALDLLTFRRWIRAARCAPDRATARARYGEALALWRGDPLADVDALRDHPAVLALARERDQAVVDLADAALATGRVEQAMPHLFALAGRDPLHGAGHARLMLALAARGETAAALRLFERIGRRLADELGVHPDPELLDARRRIIHRRPLH